MADGNVQLKLQVSLDTVYLGKQLAGLSAFAKQHPFNIVPKIDSRNLQHLVKSVGKKITVNINDTQLQLLSTRLDKAQEKLAALKAADNKVVVGVTAKAAVTQKDARKVRSDVYRSVMENGGKILLPVGLQPISQTAVNAFKADLKQKLGTITVNVKANLEGASVRSGAKSQADIDADVRRGLQVISEMGASRMAGGAAGGVTEAARRESLRKNIEDLTVAQLKQVAKQLEVGGVSKLRRADLINKIVADASVDMVKKYLDPQAMMRGGDRGQLQKVLDTFARGVFHMLGMDPAQLRAEEQARRAAAARAANVPTPFGLLPSVTRRTQTAQGVNAIMQGTGAAGGEDPAGKLALSAETLRRRVDAILAQYFKVVEAQIREDFGGAELRQNLKAFAYMAQALRDAEQRTREARVGDAVHSLFQRVERALNDAARAAESQAIRNVRVVDFNAMPAARSLPMLPPAGGSGGGRDRVTGSGQPRGGAIVPFGMFRQTELPSAYRAGGQMARALGGADQFLRQSRVPLAGAIEELGGEFAQATKQVLLYGTAYKGLAFFMDLPNQALSAATALQTFRNQLNAVTGSAENANRSFSFVDGLAERFAVPLASVRQGFVRMYASMEPADFGASEIEGLFSGVSKAAATFGMSREQVDRVTYAFSQMASKGQIMAEELRGQLGDVLPGSLALFAKAAQMELPEFTKAMEDGRFSGEAMRVVLNNVAILMNQQFAKGAEGAAKTLQGALNQMQNSLQKLYEAFEPLVNQVAQQAFPLISSAVSDATKAVQAFTATMGGSEAQAAQLTGMARQVYDTMRQLTEIGQAVVGVVASLGPVLGNTGRLFLFVTQQIARLIKTPLGGALSNWLALTILLTAAMRTLALTGVLLLGRQLMILVRQLALVAAGLRTTITLSASARLGLLGLGAAAVIAAIMAVGTALDGTNRKLEEMSARSRQTAQDLMAMAVAGDVASVTGEMTEAKTQAQSLERSKKVLERLRNDPGATVTEAEFEDLQSKGLASGLLRRRSGIGEGQVVARPNQVSANLETATRGWQEQLNRWGNAEEALDTAVQRATELQRTPTLQAIPPAAVDPADAQAEREKAERKRQAAIDKALRDAETFARQQGQLITATAEFQNKQDQIRFENLQALSISQFEHEKDMIDARHEYEMAGLDDIQARHLKYYKEQKDIQLRNLRTIQDAMRRIQEADIRLQASRRVRSANAQAAALLPAEGAAPAGEGAGGSAVSGPNTWAGVTDMARQAGAKFPELVAAQWALESAWGSKPSGQNNMFGLKGGGSSKTTQEFVGGQWKTITDSFLNFQNVAEGVQYLVDRWYKNFKGYTGVNAAGTREAAAQMLSSQGYATDPAYANKLIDLMRKAPANAAMGAAPAAPALPPPAGAAAAAPAARAMPRLTKGGTFQGFEVTGVPGEGRAYRNGTHEGYDIATPIGTAISYAIGGIVKRIDRAGLGNAGKMIEVELENGVVGYSAHLSEVLMEVGQRFTANQIIAKTGATGAGTGPHLHQESAPFAYKQGKAAESLAYLQLGGTRLPASGARHAMARAGQGAEFDVEVAQLEKTAIEAEALRTITQSLALSIEQLRTSIASQAGEIFPVEQMQLEAVLLKQRNKLLLEGAPEEYIAAQEKLATGDMERAAALGRWQQSLSEAKNEEALLASKLEEGGENVALYTKQLENARARVKLYEDAIAKLPGKQSAFTLEVLKNTLAQLQNADALKKVRDTIETIERVVGDAMGSYKNFLVNVARGEGLTKSLKEFQNALRDQALTLFFDFVMKPMQKFMEDSLKGVFGVPIEEQIRQEQIQKLQEQINLLTQIRDNTSGVGNAASTLLNTSGGIGGSGFLPLTGGLSEAAVNAPSSVDLRAMVEAEEGIRATSESMYQLGATMPALGQGVGQLTQNFAASAVQSGAAAKTWQQSLGATVQSIGMAAGAVMSIAGGVSQIKEGGVSGVLGGIGSIFMGIGGALGGFGGLGSLFGGGASAGASFAAPSLLSSVGPIGGLSSGFAIPRFATGGIVQGPTLGLVGEGKYNEAIVPLPDGRSIPVKMAGGQSAREAMQTGGMASASPSLLSFSFETTNIGGVEYVSRDQLELAMAATRKQAAKEGAKRGMDMTMDKIRNSPAARQSIAMGRR